jgi:hypothetical protein
VRRTGNACLALVTRVDCAIRVADSADCAAQTA